LARIIGSFKFFLNCVFPQFVKTFKLAGPQICVGPDMALQGWCMANENEAFKQMFVL